MIEGDNIEYVKLNNDVEMPILNFGVFYFELSEEDIEFIKKLDTGDLLFFNNHDPNMVEWFDNMIKVRRKRQDESKKEELGGIVPIKYYRIG